MQEPKDRRCFRCHASVTRDDYRVYDQGGTFYRRKNEDACDLRRIAAKLQKQTVT